MDVEQLLTRGVAETINKDSLIEKLVSGKPMRIKYGVDPTRPDIHLGHTVQLWKLRKLQEAGHIVIFLIGDYTTKIGDPSGRNATRPVLTDEEIKANTKTYLSQVGKILDLEKTEIRYNSEWFGKMDFSDILQLAGKFTVAQIIERDDFQKRLEAGSDIGLHEILYPLMQAYDSVQLNADIEFGGTDQKFNLLAGRELQKKMGLIPQDIIMTKLLVGLDGQIKMSKSANNYIGINDEPNQMFGKIMSIPDRLMLEYYELCTNVTDAAIVEIKKELESGENPKGIKVELAKVIVEMYYSAEAAETAAEEFEKVYSKKEIPTELPILTIKEEIIPLTTLLLEAGFSDSKSEAKRLIEQGAVEVNGIKITDVNQSIEIESEMVIRVGKHKFVRIEKN